MRQVATRTPRLLARVEGRVGVLVFNSPERRNALGDDFSPFLRAMVSLTKIVQGLAHWPNTLTESPYWSPKVGP